jgi:hypothetical protein
MPRKMFKKLYINAKDDVYDRVKVRLGSHSIETNAPANLVRKSTRGSTWECWIVNVIMLLAARSPEVFGHPVLLPYVERNFVWLVYKRTGGRPSHAVRYKHNMSRLTKKFDEMGRERFVRYLIANYPSEGPKLILSPPPPRLFYSGPPVVTGTRKTRISRGAMRRAIDAHLIPNTEANRRESLKQMRGPEFV